MGYTGSADHRRLAAQRALPPHHRRRPAREPRARRRDHPRGAELPAGRGLMTPARRRLRRLRHAARHPRRDGAPRRPDRAGLAAGQRRLAGQAARIHLGAQPRRPGAPPRLLAPDGGGAGVWSPRCTASPTRRCWPMCCAAYRQLDAYPEVPEMLRALRRAGSPAPILSNGEPEMLDAAVRRRRPGAAARCGAQRRVGAACSSPTRGSTGWPGGASAWRRARWAFVSANPWDAFGAYELRLPGRSGSTASGAPDEYGLRGSVPELTDLAALPDLLA